MADWFIEVTDQGFAIIESVIDAKQIAHLCSILDSAIPQDKRAGTRKLLGINEIDELAHSQKILNLINRVLGQNAKPVRAILFDKQPGANWNLAYHQDRAISIKKRIDTDGFIGWSEKEGVPHVLPPAFVLENILAIRLHLDDCTPDNAPLRVSPRTHTFGLIAEDEVPKKVAEHGESICTCNAGDALLMRPLLLHASSASESPRHRRVIHIEYSASELPNGLEWYD